MGEELKKLKKLNKVKEAKKTKKAKGAGGRVYPVGTVRPTVRTVEKEAVFKTATRCYNPALRFGAAVAGLSAAIHRRFGFLGFLQGRSA